MQHAMMVSSVPCGEKGHGRERGKREAREIERWRRHRSSPSSRPIVSRFFLSLCLNLLFSFSTSSSLFLQPQPPLLPPSPQRQQQQPQIILLREGTDTSQGKPQLVSNINACAALADVVRTTLGPRGMDKLIHDDRGNVTISNDGATIMRLLEVVHPAASLLVDVARSQDAEAGDGTTTVVLLAGELLRAVKPFVEDGAPPRAVARALRAAGALACARLRELAVPIGGGKDGAEKREMLIKCASTSLNSKLVCGEKEFFAAMVVDAVSTLDQRTLDLSMLGVKKVVGGKGREREREREGREREREFFFAFSRGLAGGERKSATHKKVEREETERERNETHSHPPPSPPPPPHSLSLSLQAASATPSWSTASPSARPSPTRASRCSPRDTKTRGFWL